jgi:hypothetical protein
MGQSRCPDALRTHRLAPVVSERRVAPLPTEDDREPNRR